MVPGTPVKPSVLSVNTAGVPEDLRREKRWVLWRYDYVNERWAKVPYQANGLRASSNKPATWNTFESMVQIYLSRQGNPGAYDGIGVCLGGGIIGIDVDNCIHAGMYSPLAQRILQIPGYAEVSPSGRGLHIITRAENVPSHAEHGVGLEVYRENRYFCFTGCQINGHQAIPYHPQDDIILRVTGAEFQNAQPATLSYAAPVAENASFLDPPLGLSDEEIRAHLSLLDATDYNLWIRVGTALHHETQGEDRGLELWDTWSATSSSYVGFHDLEKRYQGFGRSRTWVTLRSVIAEANKARVRGVGNQVQVLRATLASSTDPVVILAGLTAEAGRLTRDDPTLRGLLIEDIRARVKALGVKPPTIAALRQAMHGKAIREAPEGELVADPTDPHPAAENILSRTCTLSGTRVLHYQSGAWYLYHGSHYKIVSDDNVRKGVWTNLRKAWRHTEHGAAPYKPTSSNVSNVMDAMKSLAALPDSLSSPSWIDGRAGPLPQHLLPMENGLLDVRIRHLYPHDPNLFGTYALPYAWDAGAPPCLRWDQFLEETFPGDPDAQETLEEIIGYVMLPDHRFQKMFLLVGESRSGKGTIGHVIRALIGEENVIGPQMATLSGQFGLQNWIGKPLAIMPDARPGRADTGIVAERTLAITSGDTITVDRKNQDHWTGVLPTRIILLANKVPSLPDGALALVNRFVVLHFKVSFLGREDTHLLEKLKKELPGILHRVLAARDRLYARGKFLTPDSSLGTLSELRSSVSAISEWLDDCCHKGVHLRSHASELYQSWRGWCREMGRDHPGSAQGFTRDLYAVIPTLAQMPRSDGVAGKDMVGLCLRDAKERNDNTAFFGG